MLVTPLPSTLLTCQQVLLNVLTLNRNLSDSLARGRLHPDLQSNLLQVDSECRANSYGMGTGVGGAELVQGLACLDQH